MATGTGDGIRILAVMALVWFWGLRLTGNWLRGWSGLGHEDWRYGDLRTKTGAFYPLVNLLGIHGFPTVLVFLGCIPVYFLLQDGGPMTISEWAVWVFGVGMVVLEWVADEQLWAFRRTRNDTQQFLQTGLWSWSRHPNYFGEAFFWVSLWILAAVGGQSPWWAGLGAWSMIGLFLLVSIPLMKQKNLARKPGYDAYSRRTSAFFPWPPRRD
jgi:steroid 5-alpha reductase family enzyme